MIPGPSESLEAFQSRIEQAASSSPSFQPPEWELAAQHTLKLFDIHIDWIQVEATNDHLSIWEAAATWIQPQKEGGESISLQIPIGKHRRWVEKFVSLEEVLSHEMVHVARGLFSEKHFEEILAYKTASKSWRRYWGPLWQNPKEIRIFLMLLLLGVGGEWFSTWMLALPLFALSLTLVRLIRNQYLFSKCQKQLKPLLKAPQHPLPVMLRLTDQEIFFFAKNRPLAISQYISEQESLLRWKTILPYFDAKRLWEALGS